MKTMSVLFVPFWFLCLQLVAHMQESYSIVDILKYLNPATHPERMLIVLDLDNMVLINNVEPDDQLGSPQWLGAMIREKMKVSGLTKLQALEYTLPIHFKLVPYVTLTPVEGEITVSFIRLLQQAGYKVIALTARSPEHCKKETLDQLHQMGIDFCKSRIGDRGHIFSDRFEYVQGVAFVAGGNKGERLWQLLQNLEYIPDTVIVVDDKDYYLYEYEGVLKQYGIPHICLWYRYCDDMADAYDLSCSEKTVQKLRQVDAELDALYTIWSQGDTHHANFYTQAY